MLNIFGITGIVIGITNLVIGFLVYVYDRKNPTKQWWALFAVSVSVWGFGSYLISLAENSDIALFWWRLSHIGIIAIPYSFLIFAHHFFGLQTKLKTIILSIITLAFLVLNTTGLLINSVVKMFGSLYYDSPPTIYYKFFVTFFIYCMSSVFVFGIRAYINEKNISKKRQYLYFSVATLIGSIGGSTSFLPVFGLEIYPYFNATIVFFPFIIGYAILRYNLFDLKAVITELLMFLIWILLLLKAIFSSNKQDLIINWSLLVIVIVLGTLLIKSIRKEIATREKIQKLASEVSEANAHLKELDAQKTEFVSLASHQLRGPLTVIKGYGSMLLEGDFGEMSSKVKDAVDKIYKSTQDLVIIVGDYLDVSRIEQGRMQYDFSTFDLRELLKSMIGEMQQTIDGTHLTIDFDITPSNNDHLFKINADKGKIKQVIGNLIDNSVKYTPSGSIHVWLSYKEPNKALVSISDTGVGIHKSVLPKLFAKFSRAPDASKTNILGTGLGLYIAKKIIESHNGKIWVESEGVGKGATFFIQLDLV